ncbi:MULTISPECIES: DUF1993 domain-containing protein [Rhodomicrobium]|uniref:DUF1993 domain-containing protein n=1 Tax=Rhodomicrobium TaxID=1068 RepID=UPI000B4AB242|nr:MULTISPECIES: DUF1993 domain-containing protein [Rhodomicrobium]
MSLTLHQAVFPTVIRTLTALNAILDKAALYCETRKIDPSVLLGYRLAPDMFDFKRQIQSVTDQAKGMAARLSGAEVPSYPDVEVTFDELKARLAKTIEFVKSVTPEKLEGGEDREIVLKMRVGELRFKGSDYAFGYFMPNFFFHATTAYDILRHAGLEIGKRDFLGGV